MKTNDPKVKTKVIDGQVLYFPLQEAWEDLKKCSEFGGSKIPVPDLVFPKVEATQKEVCWQSARCGTQPTR